MIAKSNQSELFIRFMKLYLDHKKKIIIIIKETSQGLNFLGQVPKFQYHIIFYERDSVRIKLQTTRR